MKTTHYLPVVLASLIAADSLAAHSAASQTLRIPGPPASVIAELERSLTEHPDDALLMGRLAVAYQQAGQWKAGYQLARRRLAATPQDTAALYDAGAAALFVIMGRRKELTPQEIGQIAEEGVQHLARAISQVSDFTSAMIYKSRLYREQSQLASDPGEIAKLEILAAAAMIDAIQTKRPGTAPGFPGGAFAALPVVVIPTELRAENLLPPGTASFLAAPTEVPRPITRIVEESPTTPATAGQNSSFSFESPTVLTPNPDSYDIGPFMRDVLSKLMASWYALMPEAARRGEKGRVLFQFTIMKDGTVQDRKLVITSGNQALDSAAEVAIQHARFAPLPTGFKGDRIILSMPFLYNIKSGER